MKLRTPTGRELGTGLAVVSVIALLALVPSDARDEDSGGAVEVAAGQDGTTPTTLHDHQKMLRDLAAKHHHHADDSTSDAATDGDDHASTSDAHASHETSTSGHALHETGTHTTHNSTAHTGHTATQVAAHEHTGTTGSTATEHDHTSTSTGNPSNPNHNHPTTPGSTVPGHQHPTTPTPTGPITSLSDPRLTAQQKANAQALIDRTTSGMAPLMTSAAVLAAGYTWINDRAGGYRHYVNFSYLSDGRELDPNRIESIVMQEQPNGGLKIVSALYILELGKTMANVPNIAGSLTTWHIHTNLCWRNNVIVGTTGPNHCPAGSTSIITPPMLHVWLPGAPAQPCGPFAGLGEHGGGDCSHEH